MPVDIVNHTDIVKHVALVLDIPERDAAKMICVVIDAIVKPTDAMMVAAVQNHIPMTMDDPPIWLACYRAMIAALRKEIANA